MKATVTDGALDRLFDHARTPNHWRPDKVPDDLLRALHDRVRWGPTSMNTQPMRLVFVTTAAQKLRLLEAVAPGNRAKVEAAPVTVIVGQDLAFHRHLARMAPHASDPAAFFRGKDSLIRETAFRNSTLQGGYLILAARAMGLDVGPMSGFDAAKLDALFFPDSEVESNFIMNLGYGDPEGLYPRAPRFEFDEVCRIV